MDKAVRQVRQSETVHQQQSLLREEEARQLVPIDAVERTEQPEAQQSMPVDAVKGWAQQVRGTWASNREGGQSQSRQKTLTSCPRCGRTPTHDITECPARGMVCRKCGKRGHFQRVCRASKISTVQELPNQWRQGAFLGKVSKDNNPWTVRLRLNGRPTKFCIDTGAAVTVISDKEYNRIGPI